MRYSGQVVCKTGGEADGRRATGWEKGGVGWVNKVPAHGRLEGEIAR